MEEMMEESMKEWKEETGNEEEEKKKEGRIGKKRGRKRKEEREEDIVCRDQNKYFVDVSKDNEHRQVIQGYLKQANQKSYGREIILKDLVLMALPKLSAKDIEKIQENSLSEMERVTRALDEYNSKNELKLTLGEFLVKKLALQ